jgi:hypothetical protein
MTFNGTFMESNWIALGYDKANQPLALGKISGF